MKTITTLVLPIIVAFGTSALAAELELKKETLKDPRFQAIMAKERGPILGNQNLMPRWVAPKSLTEEFANDAKLTHLQGQLESYVDGGLVVSFPTVKSETTFSGEPAPANVVGTPVRAFRRYQLHRSANLAMSRIRSHLGKEVRLTIKVDKNGVPLIMTMSRPK